jgi:hypothetical protein
MMFDKISPVIYALMLLLDSPKIIKLNILLYHSKRVFIFFFFVLSYWTMIVPEASGETLYFLPIPSNSYTSFI